MSEVFDIPLYYISFQPNSILETQLRTIGFTNINHFTAIDGKKINLDQLKKDNLVTIRGYDDIKYGRFQSSGLSSMGCIGCTLSHYNLWKLCIEKKWPSLIICEDDNEFNRKPTPVELARIQEILTRDKGIYVSGNIGHRENYRKHIIGLHFYIPTYSACEVLVKQCFPIDVQTDWYVSHLATIGDINIEGFKISHTNRPSIQGSVQDICISCVLPRKQWFYTLLLLLLIGLFTSTIYYRKRYMKLSHK